MRLRRTLSLATATCAAATAIVVSAVPAHAAGRSIADCAQHLDCSLDDINLWSMPDRLRFVRALQDGPVTQWLGHGFADWHGIEGIIEFFRDHTMGAPNTWVSWTDAGILKGLERGTALALGYPSIPALDANDPTVDGHATTCGSQGSGEWQGFLTDTKAGNLAVRATHDLHWSLAEQAATDFGSCVATSVFGLHPVNDVENNWFNFSQAFRWIMRNEDTGIATFAALLETPQEKQLGLPPSQAEIDQATTMIDGLTDITSSANVYHASSLAWAVANGDWGGLFTLLTSGGGQTGGGDTPPALYTAWNINGDFYAAMVRVNLGAPTNFAHAVTGGRAQDFGSATVYYSAGTGTWAVYGGIRTHYDALGGSGSMLGLPTSDEQSAPGGGRENTFAGSSCGSGSVILYSANSGAAEMQGCIYRDFLAKFGGPAGQLGYPVSDEIPAPGPGNGRVNYMNGTSCNGSTGSALYWTAGTGTWPVKGCIFQKYGSMGQSNSSLGFPTSGEYSTSQGTRQDFTGGYMIWANGVATPYIAGGGCISYGGPSITGPDSCTGFYTTSTWFAGGGVGLDGQEIWTYANGTSKDSTANYGLAGLDTIHAMQLQAYVPNNHSDASHAHYHYCSPGGGCADGYVNQNNYTNAWAPFGTVCTTDGTATIQLADDGGDAYPVQIGADAIRAVRTGIVC